MASTAAEIEQAIQSATAPGFRERLLARGQARAMIWRDGVLPEDAPPFSTLLTYDLLSYGYSLLNLGIRLRESQGDRNTARVAFEHAASAIESVALKGSKDEERDFHRFMAAAAYHLGQFSARAYSMLQTDVFQANLAPSERALAHLMLRDLEELSAFVTQWRLTGNGSDEAIMRFLQEADSSDGFLGSADEDMFGALDLAVIDNFMAAIATALLGLERGEVDLVNAAVEQLRSGLNVSVEINLVPQWWYHRVAIHLLGDLWDSSFHVVLPKLPPETLLSEWSQLRELFMASLFRRSRAEIELWPSQVEAASKALQTNEDLVISLPTGAGKTRIAELCMLATLATGKRVIFVTPLRALSAQTEVNLQRTFQPLGKTVSSLYGSIGTSAIDENLVKSRDIVVATPEKLDFALRSDPSLIDDVGLIVLDEGHMIGLGEREVRYEAQIQRLLKRADAAERRIVCLSAILPSGDQLSDFVAWLTGDQDGGLIQKDWRPTRLRYGEVEWLGNHAQLNIQVGDEKPFVPKFLVHRVPPKKKRKEPFPRDQRELCIATAWRLVDEGQTVLIFCPLRVSVETFARSIVDLHERGLLPSLLAVDEDALADALAIGAEWFGKSHPVIQCLRLGVAIHHGALPTPFRKEIERLLREQILRITVSSPTLAQGLNLSATSLVFHSITRRGETISSSEFRNVVGRAGRAYVDIEGLVLYPMFDNKAGRRIGWRNLINDQSGHELESGLLRLVMTLMARMADKIGSRDVNKLVDYVVNNAAAWSFPKLLTETADEVAIQENRWNQFLASLDTAILSLVGEQDVNEAEIEAKLDEILGASLWERRLKHRTEPTQKALRAGLAARARFIWRNSSAGQRRGYFLAGLGLDAGQKLDDHRSKLIRLLVAANAAILFDDEKKAIEAISAFAEVIFAIPPFIPEVLPDNWEKILAIWLEGKPIAELPGGNEDETLQFIEQGLIYRLPWAMEALRVRIAADGGAIGDGLTTEDVELGVAAGAVETGTLNRSAAILMRAGFSARTAAIKAVIDTGATFTNASELHKWLTSEVVESHSMKTNWPSSGTAELWRTFRSTFAPAKKAVWQRYHREMNIVWSPKAARPAASTPVRIDDDVDGKCTLVLTADAQLLGSLAERLNPERQGLVLAVLDNATSKVKLEYLGPDDLLNSRTS